MDGFGVRGGGKVAAKTTNTDQPPIFLIFFSVLLTKEMKICIIYKAVKRFSGTKLNETRKFNRLLAIFS